MQACDAREALAHHWGTFQLTDEPVDEPPEMLAKALEREKIEAKRFRVVRPGAAFEMRRVRVTQRLACSSRLPPNDDKDARTQRLREEDA